MSQQMAAGKTFLCLRTAGDLSMSQVKQHSVQAIVLMLLATFFMSTMDVVIKILVEHYPTFQVVFLRCLMSLALFATWILFTGVAQVKTAYPRGHLMRGLLGVVMLLR